MSVTAAGIPKVLTNERTSVDEPSDNFDGWFCIKTNPYPCPCGNFIADFATWAHLVVVWPEKDDPNILDIATFMQGDNDAGLNRNPRIIEYEQSFGPAISYYDAVARRKPAHQP